MITSAPVFVVAALLTAWSPPARAACAVPRFDDMPVTVGIVAHGHQIGGMGIVSLRAVSGASSPGSENVDSATDWSLTLLSPGGLALFTAEGRFGEGPDGPARIQTGLDAWRPWLEKLPLGRDLRTAFTVEDGPCAGGRIRTRVHTFTDDSAPTVGWLRCWLGPGGKLHAEILPGRAVLQDRHRGYTLTIVAPGRPLPSSVGSPSTVEEAP